MKESIKIPRIKKGDKVFWLDPARARDGMECCREYEVTERRAGMLLLDDRIEALHKECYLKSEYCCPVCGRPLYYEKSYNTKGHYPLICFECDENFYTIECGKDLSYGHIAMLTEKFDENFEVRVDNPEDYDDLYCQALTQFTSEWRDGVIASIDEFFDAYGGDYNHLYRKEPSQLDEVVCKDCIFAKSGKCEHNHEKATSITAFGFCGLKKTRENSAD